MAKKNTEKVSRKKQAEPRTDDVKANKQSKSKEPEKVSGGSLELFPGHLQAKFQDFGNLYNQINSHIDKAGKGSQFDVDQKREDLSKRIQEASEKVFSEEVKSAEEWIEKTKQSIQEQIDGLEGSYEKLRAILEATNAFKGDQISTTLDLVEQKINEKKAELKTYQDLGDLSRSIYS